jgi:hypothetical protein
MTRGTGPLILVTGATDDHELARKFYELTEVPLSA